MKKILTNLLGIAVFLFSCQKKEKVDPNIPDPTGNLLVKAYQINLQNNDTTVTTFQWDPSSRLVQYQSVGIDQGNKTFVKHKISRNSEGKIAEVISISKTNDIPYDSVVYVVYYKPGSNRLDHTSGTHFSRAKFFSDSTTYTYNSNGMIASIEIFSDLVYGSLTKTLKEEYVYDTNGNPTTITSYTGANNIWSQIGITTHTYGTHKASVTLGEECFIIIPKSGISKNNTIGTTINGNIIGSYSKQKFNSFDKPIEEIYSLSPQSPGTDWKYIYYYQ